MLILLVILAMLNSSLQILMSAYPYFPYTAAYFGRNLPIMEYFYKSFSLSFAFFLELVYFQSTFYSFKLHLSPPIASVWCTAWGSRGRAEFSIELSQCKTHGGLRGTETLIWLGQFTISFLDYNFYENLLALVIFFFLRGLYFPYKCAPHPKTSVSSHIPELCKL